MQVGLNQLIAAVISVVLIIFSAFAAGTKWNTQIGTVPTSTHETATSSEEFLAEEEDEIPAPETPLYTVLKIIDGDTISVNREGKKETVRLIGIDTPEINDSRKGVECFGTEAASYATELLSGKKVRLEMDQSQGERDKYKRLLAYVFREDGLFVNKDMVHKGFAHEYTYNLPYKYQAQLKAAEMNAREEEMGLWAADACPAPVSSVKKAKTSLPKNNIKAEVVAPPIPMNSMQAAAALAVPAQATSVPMSTASLALPLISPVPEKPTQSVAELVVEKKPEPVRTPPAPKVDSSTYVCSTNTYNCPDFKTQAEAQAAYDSCGGVSNDVHRLDKNKDGHPCDSLP